MMSRAQAAANRVAITPMTTRSASRIVIVREDELPERDSRLIYRCAADDRADDLNVLDLFRVHRMRIVGQHDKVGQLAGGDRPLERFLMRCVGAVDRVDLERLVDRDALIESPRRT